MKLPKSWCCALALSAWLTSAAVGASGGAGHGGGSPAMAGGHGAAVFHGGDAVRGGTPGYTGRGSFGRGYYGRGYAGRPYGFYHHRGYGHHHRYYGYPYGVGFVGFGFYGYPYGYPYVYDYDYYGYDPDYPYNVAVDPRNRVTPSVAVMVQAELARQGYYDGRVDGVVGTETRRAIREYQEDRGLPVNGRITPELLSSLKKR